MQSTNAFFRVVTEHNTYVAADITSMHMATVKKTNVNVKCRTFHEKWTYSCFFVEVCPS